jgi:phosphatidylglycerophosphatase A
MSDISGPLPPSSVPFAVRAFATGGFSGYAPLAPGTFGSGVGILLYLTPGMEHPLVLGVATVVVFILGAFASNRMEQAFGEDPSIVVIDEIVGMWIALLFLPKSLTVVLVAFLLFRLFDIVKPPPARASERIPNGWGVMMDDVVAGVYANAGTWIALMVIPGMQN